MNNTPIAKHNDEGRSPLDYISPYLISCLLILATLTVYWQVKSFPFSTLDDPLYVSQNASLHNGLTIQSITWAFTTRHAGFWIPATWLSYLVDFELHGLAPGGYHLTNLLLHLANVLLLFVLLLRMTGRKWQSALVGALFALHPLHVESVVWITERKDVLSTFLGLLAILSYVFYVKSPGYRRYLFVLFFLCLSLMAKPMLVTLPFVLLLLDYWPLNRWRYGQNLENKGATGTTLSISHLVREKIPLFSVIIIASIVVYLIQSNKGVTEALPLGFRLQNALVSYVIYMGKMFWPANFGLLYPLPDHFAFWQVGGAFLILLAITLLAIRTAFKYPFFITGWFWFLGTLVPVIGLVQVGNQAYADRFTYVPLIGLYIVFAWGLDLLLAKRLSRKIFIALVVTLLLSPLMLKARHQVGYWRDSETLYRHTLKITEGNHQLHSLLGGILLTKGKVEESVAHSVEAIRIKPESWEAADAHYNLGLVYSRKNQTALATQHYSKALSLRPAHLKARINLGIEFMRSGRLTEAASHFSQILAIEPDHVEANLNQAKTLTMMGKLEEGISYLTRASRLAPDREEIFYNLGIARKIQDRQAEAIDHFKTALRINPNFKQARRQLEKYRQTTSRQQEKANQ